MRVALPSAVGAFLLVTLTACSSPAPEAHQDLWVATESSGVSGAAIVAGDLTRNAGGCFGLSMPYGQPGESEFYTTQFPKGTEVLEDESGVALPNGDIVMLGEFINGGGGYLSESSLDELENFPASCPSAEVAVLEAL